MSVEVIAFGEALSPDQILLRCMEHSSTAKVAVVVMLNADDEILTASSSGSCLKRLGMVEVLRDRLVRSMDDE